MTRKKYLIGSVVVLLTLVKYGKSQAAGPSPVVDGNCYTDPIDTPKIYYPAINILPGIKSPIDCQISCNIEEYSYCAIQAAEYCLCMDDATGLVSATDCLFYCEDGSPCGGNGTSFTVYTVSSMAGNISITNLTFTGAPNVPTQCITGEVVTAIVEASSEFYIDWGDGNCFDEDLEYTYQYAGTFQVTALLVVNPKIKHTVELTVMDPLAPSLVNVTCPDGLVVGEPTLCDIGIDLAAGQYEVSYSMVTPTDSVNFTSRVADMGFEVIGSTKDYITNPNTTFKYVSNKVYILSGNPIKESGYISKIDVSTSSVYILYELAPKCHMGGTYNSELGMCTVHGCDTTSTSVQCNTGHICTTSLGCSSGTTCDRTAPSTTNYEIVNEYQSAALEASIQSRDYIYVQAGNYLGLGCAEMDCGTVLANFVRLGEIGDRVLVSDLEGGLKFSFIANHRLMAHFQIRHDNFMDFRPNITCDNPAPYLREDIADAESADAEQYVKIDTVFLTYQVTNLLDSTVTSSEAGMICQTPILEVECPQENWWPYGTPMPYHVIVRGGSPIFMSLTVDEDPHHIYWESAVDVEFRWNFTITFTNKGTHFETGNANNSISAFTYSAVFYVMPPLTDSWQAMPMCPCLDIEDGFPIRILLPTMVDPPWNATVNVTYSLGSLITNQPLDFGTYSLATNQAEIKQFLDVVIMNSGIYNITIDMENEVSFTSFTFEVEVDKGLRGVSGNLTWDDKGVETKGLGLYENIFICNETVYIYPYAVDGVPEYWRIHIQELEETFIVSNSTSNITYVFLDEGTYTILVEGYNSVQGYVSSENITIELYYQIVGYDLTDDGELGESNVTLYVQAKFGVLTPISCMEILWGDNTTADSYGNEALCKEGSPEAIYRGPLVNPMDVPHVYEQEGKYKVISKAYDKKNVLAQDLELVVAYLPCKMPKVNILDQVIHKEKAQRYMKSLPFTVLGLPSYDCTVTPPMSHSWTITKIDEDANEDIPLQNIRVEDIIPSSETAQMTVPALFLDWGLYKFTYTFRIEASKIYLLERDNSTYIYIYPTPLVASIMGQVTGVTRGYGRFLDMSPDTYSMDPDNPDGLDNIPMNLTFWCRDKDTDVWEMNGNHYIYENEQAVPQPYVAYKNPTSPLYNHGGCFGKGKGVVSVPTRDWSLNTGSFAKSDGIFEIVLRVTKDTRVSYATLLVTVTMDPPPSVSIRCANPELCVSFNGNLLINPNIRLALVGECISDCGDDVNALRYQWSLKKTDGSALNEADYCITPTECTPTFLTPKNTTSLAVRSTFFDQNFPTEQFSVRLSIRIEGNINEGYAETIVVLNKPPDSGRCYIKGNDTGYAVVTTFPVVCEGWKDPERIGIESYSFYYIANEARFPIAASIQSTINLVLPVGIFEVHVEIFDRLNAATDVTLTNITVEMPDRAEYENYNASTLVEYYTATGDGTSLAMLLTAMNSVKENADWLSIDPSTFGNLTESEIEDRMLDVATMNKNQLESAYESMEFSSLAQINVGASLLQTSIGNMMNVENAPLTLDAESKDVIIDFVTKISDNLFTINAPSPDDYSSVFANTLDAATIIMYCNNDVIDKKRVPIGDRTSAQNWEYETEPIGTDVDVPDDITSQMLKNIIETNKEKGKDQIATMLDIVDKTVNEINDKMVIGETHEVLAPNGATSLIAKFSEPMLKEGYKVTFKAAKGSIVLPKNFCPSRYINKKTNCRSGVSLSAVLWPVITHPYTETRKKLARNTKVITFSILIDGNKIPINNKSEPILLDVPRHHTELPEFLCVNNTDNVNEKLPFIYHKFNVSNEASAITMDIIGNTPPNMILYIDNNHLPTPNKYWKRYRVQALTPTDEGSYSLFLNTNQTENKTGGFYVAVAYVKPAEIASLNSDEPLPKEKHQDLSMNPDYCIRLYTSGCYYFNEREQKWLADGVRALNYSANSTLCQADHLTPFGTGFFPSPNIINFDYVFANPGFTDNLTLYLVLIIISSVMLLMMIWAIYKDKKDFEKKGVIPLPDNKLQDKYLYELTITTGPDAEAATESNISFLLSGEYDESEIRNLPPAEGHLYRRYSVNKFVLSVPSPLGHISYIRLMHDNSGLHPYDTWQIESIIIRDLQTRKKYSFITNNEWLAFNRNDGKIDKTFSVSETTSWNGTFTQRMYSNVNHNANQDHMWLSVFMRPVNSRFDTKERVLVCSTFLYLSMLVSAMWYDSAAESSRGDVFNFGAFSLTPEDTIIGAVVVFIVYPFCLLLTSIFKRARPRKLKKCRALEAIRKQREEQKEEVVDKHNVEDIKIVDGNSPPKPKDTVGIKCIPWWTRIIAWLLGFAAIGASAFFVWSYGIMWGELKMVKWFSSFITGFFVSILITQWIKIGLYALVSSAICGSDNSKDDTDCDEELPQLKANEVWKYSTPLDPDKKKKVDEIEGVDPDAPDVEALRIKLTKEREMGFVMRGIFGYCIFLGILMVIVSGKTDYNAFLLQLNMKNAFIKPGHKILDFSKVVNTDMYWRWVHGTILPEIRAQRWYNYDPPYGLRGFLGDYNNRIMGHGIIRQIRMKKFQCKPPDGLSMAECSGDRDINLEEYRDYCGNWTKSEMWPGSCLLPEFKYHTSSELNTFTYEGRLGYYSGGGYIIRLQGPQSSLIRKFTELQQAHWIDGFTRAVILEFSTFNANVNLFCTCTIVAEFHAGGGIATRWRFEPLKLTKSNDLKGIIEYAAEILFAAATIFFTLRELWEIKKMKMAYFALYWNIAELCIILISYATIGVYIWRVLEVLNVEKLFRQTNGNGYIRLDLAARIDQYYIYLIAFILFFSTLKLIKLLQFNKRMDVLALTIKRCWDELKIFFIAFGIIFFSFCTLFFFMFSAALEEFANFLPAIQTSFKMMLGKFNFRGMQEANPLSPILFFVFSIINSMILINIMLTIILQAFNEIKLELTKRQNKYDVLEYVIRETRQALKLDYLPNNSVKPEKLLKGEKNKKTKSEQLPDKVGQLVSFINETYFDNKLNFNDPEGLKNMINPKYKPNNDEFPFQTRKKNLVVSN